METSIACWNWLMLTLFSSYVQNPFPYKKGHAHIVCLYIILLTIYSEYRLSRLLSEIFLWCIVNKWHGWSPELKAVGSLQNWVSVWIKKEVISFSFSIWWLLEKWISYSLLFFFAYILYCLLHFLLLRFLFSSLQ